MSDLKIDDDALLSALESSVANERVAIADVLERLGAVLKGNVAVRKGYPSAFELCVQRLGYSEQAAYKRVQAAKAALIHPKVLDDLREGRLTLSGIVVIAPLLKRGNGEKILEQARGKTMRELERIVAGLQPRAEPGDRIRTLYLLPSGEERVQFTFAGGGDLRSDVERAREVMRHKYPAGRLEHLFAAAMKLLLDKHDPQRKLARKAARVARAQFEKAEGVAKAGSPAAPPAEPSRRIPEAVKQAVWARDEGRCAFIADGKRCNGRDFLEIDHKLPFALGGPSDDPANLRLLCRPHNQLMARVVFGDAVVGGLNRPPPTRP